MSPNSGARLEVRRGRPNKHHLPERVVGQECRVRCVNVQFQVHLWSLVAIARPGVLFKLIHVRWQRYNAVNLDTPLFESHARKVGNPKNEIRKRCAVGIVLQAGCP